MSKLDDAMLEHIAYLVIHENAPFCYRDFLRWNDGENEHKMTHGTFRNKVSKLVKSGEVELSYYSNPTFYTLKGHPFGKPMTPNPPVVYDNNPAFQMIKTLPMDKQCFHDIHSTFTAPDIYKTFSRYYPNFPRIDTSEQIVIPSLSLSWKQNKNRTIVRTVISKTDTVSVTVGCSLEPIPFDIDGLIRFFSILAETRGLLVGLTYHNQRQYYNDTTTSTCFPSPSPAALSFSAVNIPQYQSWIITMWHFGRDSLTEYTGKQFSITTENAQHVLTRLYSKEFVNRNGNRKRRIRLEKQEYPNTTVIDAIEDKLESQEGAIDITGQPGQKEPTLGQLKIWIDRLEKVGIHIDINEILNPKKDQKEKEKKEK